jgi:exopolyphosphatase / guanosine-5'-triphosphate,3'-diphosphate pyrophosphatase
MTSLLENVAKKPAGAGPNPVPGDVRLAAIDVGSNSIHMVIAQVDADGGITTLWRMKEMVGLGRNSFPSHRLSQEAMDRAIDVLRRFRTSALRRGCEKIVAVATSAVREAENGGDFIERARRETGLVVRVVAAREEARLIHVGVRHAMDFAEGPHLIVDIGGGSVEFIVADMKDAMLLESRKLGAARITAKFVRDDPPRKRQIDAILAYYQAELEGLLARIREFTLHGAVGTSGTMENLALMCSDKDRTADKSLTIERDDLDKLVKRLLGSTAAERVRMPGLDEKRQDQIIAGALLVQYLMEQLGLKRLSLCGSALREGILLDYIARHLPDLAVRRQVADPRRRSVLDLARRCEWHESHSQQVARIALKLFDQTQRLHHLNATARELIEYGALLHDIGWHISPDAHHKHSMYLVQHGSLKEFAPEEVSTIASLTRYHRKAMPRKAHEEYAELPGKYRKIVRVGGALLRIADGLDRSHCSVVRDLSCDVKPRRIRIDLQGRGDMALELWAARRKTDLFERVFRRDVTFRRVR